MCVTPKLTFKLQKYVCVPTTSHCVGGINVLSGGRGSNPSGRTFLGWGLQGITGNYWLVHSSQSSMYAQEFKFGHGQHELDTVSGGCKFKF